MPNRSRQLLAEVAAKLIAEDGIHDYALAKRKAARQLGIQEGSKLPSNEEIDQALLQRCSQYEPETHSATLLALRQEALEAMEVFERFHPLLTGPVALGAASEHSLIEFEISIEFSKELEQFLVNHEIEYKVQDRGSLQAYLIYAEPVDIMIRLTHQEARFSAPRARLNHSQLLQVIQAQPTPA